MMKAAVCYRFGQPLVIDEIAIDEPRVNEVKVQISACAICHSDILYMDGAWGGRLPTIFGHEASGRTTSCGPGVENVKNGDKVIVSLLRSCGECFFCSQQQSNLCEHVFATDEPRRLQTVHGMAVHRGLGTGYFAEFAVVHQSQVVKIPDKLNVSSASLLACGVITGFGSVMNTASVKPDSHVVIIGAGGVGINCIQAARISSAATITAIDPNPDRLDIAKRFGATHAANPDQINPADFIKELTMNRGADFVFIATGHPDATDGVFPGAKFSSECRQLSNCANFDEQFSRTYGLVDFFIVINCKLLFIRLVHCDLLPIRVALSFCSASISPRCSAS